MSEFETIIAAAQAADEHNQEILNSRVGGFGGSDAKLFYAIGSKGLDNLSNTDLKRIAVAMGLIPQEDHVDNKYTRAGHDFEDYLAPALQGWNREELLEVQLAKNFRTFAHADFFSPDRNHVLELKYSQHEQKEVISTYRCQFQWYYMLGIEHVSLVHGQGDVEPFKLRETTKVDINKEERVIDILVKGIRILDEAIDQGWQPEIKDFEETPKDIKQIIRYYWLAKAKADAAAKKADGYKKRIIAYMSEHEASAYQGEYKNGTIHSAQLITKAGNRTFDSKKFLADHPEFDLECYYKQGAGSTSLVVK